jgi:cystathionine beta-synthase
MREKGYLDKKGLTAKDLVSTRGKEKLITIEASENLSEAIAMMNKLDISQIPVTNDKRIVGSLNESELFSQIVKNPDITKQTISEVMQPAFSFADVSTPLDLLSTMITPTNPAVLVRDFKTDETFIITRHDIIQALTK